MHSSSEPYQSRHLIKAMLYSQPITQAMLYSTTRLHNQLGLCTAYT